MLLIRHPAQSLSGKIDFFFLLEGDAAAGALCNLPAVSCCLMLFKLFALAHATQTRMQQRLKVDIPVARHPSGFSRQDKIQVSNMFSYWTGE